MPDSAPSDPRVADALRSLGTPLRLAIVRALADDAPLSPSAFATRNDIRLREAAYHFRALRDAGLITLKRVRVSGGAAEHLYVLTPLSRVVVGILPDLKKAAA